ncbi:MAG: crotonase/enoyl-CoA hydratase family protein [Oceanococcaceae bacterium]
MSGSDLVRYEYKDGIAVITLDDGKRNALPPAMFKGIYSALRQAEKDQAIVILTGREGVFSAGYDLKVMKAGNADTLRMLRAGYSLTARMLEFPYPIIAACNGHCFAMGVFMMLSADYIIGSQGDFQISANEVAIGLTMPRVPCTVLRQRLNPGAFQRAVLLSESFSPEAALQAGFFDALSTPAELMSLAQAKAEDLKKLDMRAHADSKRRIRSKQISTIRRQVPLDLVEAVKYGLSGRKPKKS